MSSNNGGREKGYTYSGRKKGIGVEGVASEIGALGRKDFAVNESKLIERLMRRFEAERYEAEAAIAQAMDVGAIYRNGSNICLDLETKESLDNLILDFFDEKENTTILQAVYYLRTNSHQLPDNPLYENRIRQRVWSLIDRGLLYLAKDRTIKKQKE